ncbi:MAG TPA: UbiD family decarboxylase [Stellaceae bacterium]|nr:UbiD family decarboxylase [Stellaceae bacterium]
MTIDTEKYRLRRFVDHLNELGEVEVHSEPVPLVNLSPIIEGTAKAVLFKQAGPERAEIVAKTAGSRRRVAAAFGTTEDRLYDAYYRRVAEPQQVVEIPSADAPVHAVVLSGRDVDLTRLPFHPQHAHDGSCYISSAMDFTVDPASGRRNVGCRRLSLRNRYECGTNVTSPSDLKRIYHGCVARGERLPITFTVGAHPLDFIGATMRQGDDELALIAQMRGETAAVVKSLTNDILVPADAEMTLEGYLDERGYVEPEGPYGEYMGYYGAIHMDPVFHCTAITMRRDVLHLTLLHGSADVLDQTDNTNINMLRTEADALRILKASGRDPVAAHLCARSGGNNNLRVALNQRGPGEARQAIHTLFGALRSVKHVFIFDADIDIRDEGQVAWAMGTRFQADEDLIVLNGMLGMTMDPSLRGRRTGAKAGFDCTKPFGRDGDIPLTRAAAKIFTGPARFQSVEAALGTGPMFYADIVEGIGSDDGRDVAVALDGLRVEGRLARDRDGRYSLEGSQPGVTGIVGTLYPDPNEGA